MKNRIYEKQTECAKNKIEIRGRKMLLLAGMIFLLVGMRVPGISAEIGIAWGAQAADAGQGTGENLVMTRQISAGELDTFSAPPGSWTDELGREYRLKSWDIREKPGKRAQEHVTRRIRYEEVEGAETLPESILVHEEKGGESAEGRISLKEAEVLAERWDSSFCVPVTFYAYGALEYELGGLVIRQEEAEQTDLWGPVLLRELGLSPDAYRLLSLDWAGDVYVDEAGQTCRQALARGEKLLKDYEAVYEGQVSWQAPPVYELWMEYELMKEGSALREPTEPGGGEETSIPEPEGGPLWYWVRSGFVLTVAAGLVGIAVGAAVLVIVWLRQRKRERKAGKLPIIDK